MVCVRVDFEIRNGVDATAAAAAGARQTQLENLLKFYNTANLPKSARSVQR